MSRHCYIATDMWTDPWYQSLDPSQKFLYLYLITNHCTNIAGIYKISMRQICFDTGYNEETVQHILNKFNEDMVIEYYENYLIINRFCADQKLKVQKKDKNSNTIQETESNIKKGIDEILLALLKSVLTYATDHGYEYEFIDFILEAKGLKEPLEDPFRAFYEKNTSSNNINLSNSMLKKLNLNEEEIKTLFENEVLFLKENIEPMYHEDYCKIFEKMLNTNPENAHNLSIDELQRKYGIENVMIKKL